MLSISSLFHWFVCFVCVWDTRREADFDEWRGWGNKEAPKKSNALSLSFCFALIWVLWHWEKCFALRTCALEDTTCFKITSQVACLHKYTQLKISKTLKSRSFSPSVLRSLLLRLLLSYCEGAVVEGGGQDPWGEHNVESDRLATGAQLREKKIEKETAKTTENNPQREHFEHVHFFLQFSECPHVFFCVCVCACFRKNSRIVVGLLLLLRRWHIIQTQKVYMFVGCRCFATKTQKLRTQNERKETYAKRTELKTHS